MKPVSVQMSSPGLALGGTALSRVARSFWSTQRSSKALSRSRIASYYDSAASARPGGYTTVAGENTPIIGETPYNKDLQNKIVLTGNVGADVEVKYLENGLKTAYVPLAVPRRNKTAMWFDVILWNELAEAGATELPRGTQIQVEGYLTTQELLDGARKVQVVARNIRKVLRGQVVAQDGSVSYMTSPGPAKHSPEKQDQLWMNLFENPSEWMDFRARKKSGAVKPRHPDFKMRSGGMIAPALWIESSPDWVKVELEKIDAQTPPNDA